MEVSSSLPAELLEAIVHPAGGRVVLIVGAGCSVEPPTRLPLAGELADECHRKLVTDGVIGEKDSTPTDLSSVADAVMSATGSQSAMVERFPPERFLNAEPNQGHFSAAALLREGAVSSIMTLNFDLTLSVALASLGATDVATITGPEDHHRLSLLNLIYLHRNINASPDNLILRTDALEREWKDRWEEIVAHRVMASPILVIVGLGSPAGVLVKTLQRILAALGTPGQEGNRTFVVGRSPAEDSAFFTALGLPTEAYVQLSWTEFTRRLAGRVVTEQLAQLEQKCRELAETHGWEEENVREVCQEIDRLGLIGLGRLRARWLLEEGAYLTNQNALIPLMADLVLGVAMVERLTGARARLQEGEVLEFHREGKRTAVLVCSGRGYLRWPIMQVRLDERQRAFAHRHPSPHRALVTGVLGGRTTISTPTDLVAEQPADNVLFGQTGLDVITVDQLRANPSIAQRLVN